MLNFQDLDIEQLTFLTTLIGAVGAVSTILSILWVKGVKPAIKFINSQEMMSRSINEIKHELTTNGGNSLKDTIIGLRTTCNRIEIRQKIIEQRTRAALHYNNTAMFETNSLGRLIWTNTKFYELTGDAVDSVDGYDWLTYINEDEREDCFNEFQSCLTMNRKFIKITKNCSGAGIKLVGFPYKINEHEHGGFLVSVSEIKET